MTNSAEQLGDELLNYRIMITGRNVNTVQCVSRYCLKQGVETLPYYGFPSSEEVILFNPHLLILCLPVPEDFLLQIDKPFILWSEPPIKDTGLAPALQATSSCIELKNLLQQTLQV